MCVEKLIYIILHQKLNGNITYLLPRNIDSDLTVQGIVMYPKLKEYILPNEMNFQEYIFYNNTFQDIMVMYHNKVEFEWIKMLADKKNRISVDNVFQHLILLTYTILGGSSSSNVGKRKFHLMIIK